ncbi:ModE family transcriptional regulator [Novosphingobium sp. PC22D]|uniref:TOBE domain-containing protein n=1 Tax=Novosphingobium sp. PC22D TaxID=1962403 RepID=UPI000BF13941|nr:TOBE domain-containing protein [Novosphingobium sp. PC22D]PEQ11740.1 ModE family transcriptional regulator [Novosphingobium sp. PC22D]
MATLARLPVRSRTTLRTSARNMLSGIVTAISHGPVNAEVGLLVNEHIVIDALVSNGCLAALDLVAGGRAVALINASFVTLLADTPDLRISARNLIGGTVVAVTEGPVDSEVVLAIGGGRELAAIVTTHSLRELGLVTGGEALACFKASHVILAAET